MRRYTRDEEDRLRMQAAVRGWARAGFLDAAQARLVSEQLATDLKRTNVLLRAALALFTALIVGALVALIAETLDVRGETAAGTLALISGLACFAAADRIVGAVHLYRYGVEEALAVFSVLLVSVASVFFTHAVHAGSEWANRIGLMVAAAAGSVVYLRFGFVYAAIGATICAALVPSQFTLAEPAGRIGAAAMFGAVFLVVRARYRRNGDDFLGVGEATFEAAACVGAYLSLNLHVFDDLRWLGSSRPAWDHTTFYWATYAATWLIPAASLADAIRAKDRSLLAAGIAMALATLATNKPYVGQPRQTWDPIALGVVLSAGAIALRRWIANGPDGCRNGYTVDLRQPGDLDLLRIGATMSIAWQDRVTDARPANRHHRPSTAAARAGAALARAIDDTGG